MIFKIELVKKLAERKKKYGGCGLAIALATNIEYSYHNINSEKSSVKHKFDNEKQTITQT